MKLDLKFITILVLVGALIVLSMRGCNNVPDVITKTDTVRVTTIRYDTIPIHDTVYITKTIRIPIPTEVVVEDDTLNNYVDTVAYDNLKIFYSLHTTGHLKKFDLGYLDTRPQIIKTIDNSITITNEITKYRNGLYVGGFVGGSETSFDVGPQVSWLNRKWLYGVNYGISSKSFSISVQHKLF